VTDDAINGSGLCLQGFSGNAASGWRDGWQADGFVLVNNRVQQEFVVQVIQIGQEISVTSIVLDPQNAGGLIVREPESLDQLMVVVGAMADKTRQPAGYQVSLDPVE
jgi:hypothetical protein